MSRCALPFIGAAVLVVFAVFSSSSASYARSAKEPLSAGSPYDLANAVNALRASFGLPPYGISSILMSTAQAQADFLASTGTMTHSGPGGIGLTDRLLAAGYPLAGDLSLGGFRAENITGGNESMPAEAAVDRWTGDSLHLNTMVSQNLTEIGAGVAIRDGRVYYVIDAARPTTGGELQLAATPVGGGLVESGTPFVIIPVTVSTPNMQGQVIHEVKPGQTLWQIAISYEVKIDDIRHLNNLPDNIIYPGNKLLIKTGVIEPTGSPTQVPTQTASPTGAASHTPMTRGTTTTSMPGSLAQSPSSVMNNETIMNVMIGIIVLAILGGGIFTWLGNSRKN